MYLKRGCHNVGSPFFYGYNLKAPPPLRKAIPLINSTCHTFTNNCVAYLVDICDILDTYL